MIIVKLMGGLGNQMFQYAAARHLACIHNVPLKMDLSYLNTDPAGAYTPRAYQLACFNLPQVFAREEELVKFNRMRKYKLLRGLQRLFPKLPGLPYALEPVNDEQLKLLTFPDGTYVDGYWQSENYFKAIAGIIRNDFTFKTTADDSNKQLIQDITSCVAISLHIRRTDYISNPHVFHFHGVCTMDYYNKAVAILTEKNPGARLFVFSDDQVWARENIKYPIPTTFVTQANAESDFEDMRLMSLCKHNIIANSSFSWWGGWLNNYPEKIVIAPEKWFNDPGKMNNNIVPEHWIKI